MLSSAILEKDIEYAIVDLIVNGLGIRKNKSNYHKDELLEILNVFCFIIKKGMDELTQAERCHLDSFLRKVYSNKLLKKQECFTKTILNQDEIEYLKHIVSTSR
ncbi:hypothetical protein [Celerinatantimonas sp. MCCC 1A17872]|uniref:hypothetical protein n=1 Tax=Celerinatantimonas sp. MCCC 1A17872 TaxID=3177514 RepID=UPI0038C20E3B